MHLHPSRLRASALSTLLCLGAAMVLFAESSEPSAAPGKVNINTASVAELAYLPRLGAKVAARIVERRKEKPFTRPEELMEVKGVGEKLFKELKPYVALSGPTSLAAKVSSKVTCIWRSVSRITPPSSRSAVSRSLRRRSSSST